MSFGTLWNRSSTDKGGKKKSGKGTGARKGTNMRLDGQYKRGKLNLRVAKKNRVRCEKGEL